jgi:hypothetical protein
MVFCLALKALNHAEYSGKGKVAPEPVSLKLSCAREGVEVKASSGRARVSERFTLTLLSGATVRGAWHGWSRAHPKPALIVPRGRLRSRYKIVEKARPPR